jgi:heme A synthase
MYTGLLHLHNLLRWVILLLLLIAIFQSFSKTEGLRKTSLFLLIAAHIQLLIGLYQWLVGGFGYNLIRNNGFSEVMKNSVQRFWAVEHIAGMLIATILITIARGKAKRGEYTAASWMYVVALILILAVVPWPFREDIARPWFPGMR